MNDDSLATALTELEDAVTNSNAEIDRLREINADLLSALQNILPMFDAGREHFTMLAFESASNKAHAAITKATGEK